MIHQATNTANRAHMTDHWHSDGRLPDDFDIRTLPFDAFAGRTVPSRRDTHLLTDPDGNRQWVFTNALQQSRGYVDTANALAEVPLAWKYLGIMRFRTLTVEYITLRRVPLIRINDARFDDTFRIRTTEDAFARAFLTDDVRAALLAQKKVMGLEIDRGLCWVRMKAGPASLEDLARWQRAVLEHADASLGYATPCRPATPRATVDDPPEVPPSLQIDLSEIE